MKKLFLFVLSLFAALAVSCSQATAKKAVSEVYQIGKADDVKGGGYIVYVVNNPDDGKYILIRESTQTGEFGIEDGWTAAVEGEVKFYNGSGVYKPADHTFTFGGVGIETELKGNAEIEVSVKDGALVAITIGGKARVDIKKSHVVTFKVSDELSFKVFVDDGDRVENQYVSVPNQCLENWYKEAGFTNKWNFVTDTVTEDITLYAKMLNLVGGRIFFIDSAVDAEIAGNANGEVTVAEVKYTFYDDDMKPIDLSGKSYKRNDEHDDITDTLTDALEDAFCYSVAGTPAKDVFYVVDSTNGPVGVSDGSYNPAGPQHRAGIAWGAHGTDITTTYGIAFDDEIGKGKAITKAVLATKDTADSAFSKMSKSDKDGPTAEAAGASPDCPSAFSSKGNNSIWAFIDFLDNGTEYSDVCWDEDTRSEWESLDNRKTAAVSNPGDCNDWFIPTIAEINMLGVWGGGLKYDAGSSEYSKFIQNDSFDDLYDTDDLDSVDICRMEMGCIFQSSDHCLWSSIENSPSGNNKNGTLVYDGWNGGIWQETSSGKWLNSNSVIAMRSF